MSKLSWFKHYNNAHNGHTLRTLWDNRDYEAYGFWWVLHELISQFEDDDARGKLTISMLSIARETGWKPSKCLRVLSRISSVSQIDMTYFTDEKQKTYVTLVSPNWLELQETRGGKRLAKIDQTPSKVSGEERSKKGEGRRQNTEIEVTKTQKQKSPQLAASVTHEKSFGSMIYDAYAEEYTIRWKKKPLRNAAINKTAQRVGETIGSEAPEVARFYVWHNKAYYVQNCHPFKLLLSDAEALHTQWSTGKQVTRNEAMSAENTQGVFNVFSSILEETRKNKGVSDEQ